MTSILLSGYYYLGMQGAEKFSIFSCNVHVKQNKFDKGGNGVEGI